MKKVSAAVETHTAKARFFVEFDKLNECVFIEFVSTAVK